MAQPIAFEKPPYDPSEHLLERLKAAPKEHAEALLSSYDILQKLHERGLLELARGGLGSYDEVIDIIVQTAGKPEMMQGLRNMLVLVSILGELDPAQLKTLVRTIPSATAQMTGQATPPRFTDTIRAFFSIRAWYRLLAAGTVVLNALRIPSPQKP